MEENPAPSLVVVRSEPHTYERLGQHSYFRDRVAKTLHGDADAAERLARHAIEVTEDRKASNLERRVAPGIGAGIGGEFAPPAWFPSLFGGPPRGGRTLANLVPTLELPPGAAQVNIPVITGGTQFEPTSGGAALPQGDLTTAGSVNQVVTIAGMVDISQQLNDQTPGGFDSVIGAALLRAYDEAVELAVVTGTGSPSFRGLLSSNLPSSHTISGSAANSWVALSPLVGQAIAAVGNDRRRPPQILMMRTRRWAWIASSLNASGNPVMTPGLGDVPDPADIAADRDFPVGPMVGLPVYLNDLIPTAVGSDSVWALRPADFFLFEARTPKVLITPEPNSGSLMVRISLHNSAAFVADRQPNGLAVVSAIPQPAGF